MSNNLLSNPLIVDTGFANPVALPDNAQIMEIYWFNPTNSGDSFVVKNGLGAVLREARCENANQSQLFPMYGIPARHIAVPTLSNGGKLYIYLRP